ncbi:uncharacterized protein LOC115033209 [Acyrthosiphon pisum]|uniref:Uncharacterized protein n=1 Tax=Acyrthosiphon pisum TaxID=7029 RepID=A0A8R2JL21_ACYPI|nr:uncharacterized protein LOC115033209 [Acyrthosiphon pisum]
MVPKNLTIDQKFNRKEICSDTLKIIKDDPSFINNIITCDETWIFTYDPETKRQSMHWKTPTSPRMKKARMSKSKFKAMLIVFFDIKGIIFVEWVPSGQTVNQYYYKEVLIKLRERVRKKRPDLWKNGWVLHQDNAAAHSAFSIQRYLTEKKISVLQHPPYSPDLAPCDFFLFPKIKSLLKGTHFQTVDDVKMKTADLLNEHYDDTLNSHIPTTPSLNSLMRKIKYNLVPITDDLNKLKLSGEVCQAALSTKTNLINSSTNKIIDESNNGRSKENEKSSGEAFKTLRATLKSFPVNVKKESSEDEMQVNVKKSKSSEKHVLNGDDGRFDPTLSNNPSRLNYISEITSTSNHPEFSNSKESKRNQCSPFGDNSKNQKICRTQSMHDKRVLNCNPN